MSDMASFNIGGYYATLTLKSDKKSFEAGQKSLSAVTGTLKSLATFARVGLVGAFLKAGQSLISFSNLASSADAKTVTLARSLRISSSELAEFRNTALLTSTNADTLTSSLLELQKKSDRLRMGEVDVGLAKSLGMMGIGYQSFLGMDTGTKFRTAMEHALKLGNNNLAGELLRDILGNAGKEMFQYLLISGKSLQEIEDRAKALLFTTDETRKKSMAFNIELKSIGTALDEIGGRFVAEFGSRMIPIMEDFLNYLIQNKSQIIGMIQGISELIINLLKITKITGDWARLMQHIIPTHFLQTLKFSKDLLTNILGIHNIKLFESWPDLLQKSVNMARGLTTIFMDILLPIKGIIDGIQDLIYYLTPGAYSLMGFALHGGAKGEKEWIEKGKPGFGKEAIDKVTKTFSNVKEKVGGYANKMLDEEQLKYIRPYETNQITGENGRIDFYVHDPYGNLKDFKFNNPNWFLHVQ